MSPKLLFFALLKIYLLIISKKILYTERQFEPEKLTVYSQYFYLRKYPQYAEKFAYDKKALFNYFNTTGISKGECASPAFDIQYYLEKNPQLKKKFGNNYNLAYLYIFYQKENMKLMNFLRYLMLNIILIITVIYLIVFMVIEI